MAQRRFRRNYRGGARAVASLRAASFRLQNRCRIPRRSRGYIAHEMPAIIDGTRLNIARILPGKRPDFAREYFLHPARISGRCCARCKPLAE